MTVQMVSGPRLAGQVVSVQSVPQGGVAVSWVGTSLRVQDASDFSRSGGQFTRAGDVTLYAYSAVAEGVADGEPDTVTTAVSVPASWPAGEVRVDVWPAAVDVYAEVVVDDGGGVGDSVQVVVPHALRPLLVEGLRDSLDRENVLIERVGQQWVVADVVGRRAQVQLSGLSDEVITAIGSANGQAQVIHSTSAASGSTYPVGSTWFQHEVSGPGVIGMWSFDGAVWQPMQLNDQVIGNLDAGSITTGVLQGIDIYSPSMTSTPRTHIGGGVVEVVRSDGESEYTTVQLGSSSDADQMMLYSGGSAVAGFSSSGDGLARDFDVSGSLNLRGTSLDDRLFALPRGIIARQKLGSSASTNGYQFGTSELGLLELTFDSESNRVYRVSFTGMVNVAANGIVGLRFRATSLPGYDGTPATPTVTSVQWAQANHQMYASGLQQVSIEHYVGHYAGRFRVLLTGATAGSAAPARLSSSDTFQANMLVEDLGSYVEFGDGAVNFGGGTPYSAPPAGTTPPADPTPVRSFVTTWSMSWYRSWRGGSIVSDFLHQGWYSPAQRYSMVGFTAANSSGGETGRTVTAALAGATISKVEVYLENSSWYFGSGGQALIGRHGYTAAPASPQTSGGAAFSSGNWTRGAGRWVTLPAAWHAGFAAGTYRGITLGEGAGSNQTYYGKFLNSPPSKVQLRVTYSR